MKVAILFVFLLMVAASKTQAEPFTVTCSEPLPEFSLGENSSPTKKQVTDLCSCIWSRLTLSDKEFADVIKRGQAAPSSHLFDLKVRSFTASFRESLESCGGFKL